MEEEKIEIEKRKKSRKEAERQAREADMKQHADKLFQGFKKLEDSHAKRAIWELFQNAIDISEGNCVIEIELNENEIIFKHNSKPFNSKTLISLIKQVSSKSEVSNESEVGQYGTGFITTHSFGKKIILNGSLNDNNNFIDLNDFEIDRKAELSADLVIKLASQEEKVFDLIEKGIYQSKPQELTTFAYQTESDLEKERAKEALENLKLIVPFVLTINKKLQVVKIYESNNKFDSIIYNKEETIRKDNFVYQTSIDCNGNKKKIKFIQDDEKELSIILPINDYNKIIKFPENLPKLFLFYPLIGSENFGFNFILHSKNFSPTEPRDGIYLNSKNENSKSDEESNRLILEKASNLVFEYLKSNHSSLNSTINLASLNFKIDSEKTLLNEYFQILKTKWVNTFLDLPIVEAKESRISPRATYFLSEELLLSDEYFDSIYDLVSGIPWKNPIPKKEVSKEWTEIVQNWDSEAIVFISIDNLLNEIQKKVNLKNFEDKSKIQQFYRYLIENNFSKKFDEYKLIPNINGDFCVKPSLKKGSNLHSGYLPIAQELIPKTLETIITPDFILEQEYEVFSRNNLYLAFTQKLQQYYDKEKSLAITDDIIHSVIKLCSIFPREGVVSTRKSIVELLCNKYEFDFEEKIIPNIEEDRFNIDETPTTALIRITILDFIKKSNEKKDYLEENLYFLSEYLNLINSNKLYRETLKSYKIFPSQSFELNYPGDLFKESEFPLNPDESNYLKDIYHKVLSKNIRKELLHNDFINLDTVTKFKIAKDLSFAIDEKFKLENLSEISEHSHGPLIVKIVEKLTDNLFWQELFPNLNDKKALIMMSKISGNPVVKNDLFKIINSDDDQISLLGELSQRKDLAKLIALGEAAMLEEVKNNADFQFKKQIGVHLEDLIRKSIQSELNNFSVEVREEQNGQDIIIKIDNLPVYYIEVKSRWNNISSILMSKNQVSTAVNEKNRYSLCCIEMSDYKVGQNDRYTVDDLNIIFDRISIINNIGAELEPLIENVLAAKDLDNEITLTGDYKATIPQKFIKNGSNFNEFVSYLIIKLNFV